MHVLLALSLEHQQVGFIGKGGTLFDEPMQAPQEPHLMKSLHIFYGQTVALLLQSVLCPN